MKFFGLDEATATSIFMPFGWSKGWSKRKVINRMKRLVENRQNEEDLKDIRSFYGIR